MTCLGRPIATTKWEHILRQVLNQSYRAKVYAAESAGDYVTLVNEAAKDLIMFGESFTIAVGGEFDMRPEPLQSTFWDRSYLGVPPVLAACLFESLEKTLLRCCDAARSGLFHLALSGWSTADLEARRRRS